MTNEPSVTLHIKSGTAYNSNINSEKTFIG